ncbi:MAG: alpha-amylase family glycosyl hydrolase [Polyangiaceae bacterium]
MLAALGALAFGSFFACSDSPSDYKPPPLESVDAAAKRDATADAPIEELGPCKTTLTFTPPAGKLVSSVAVVGEWQNFQSPGVPLLGPDERGKYSVSLELPAGLHAYKYLVDGDYQLDANQPRRKYVGNIENSAVQVKQCDMPTFSLVSQNLKRAAAGQGSYTATVAMNARGRLPDAGSVKVTLKRDGADVGPIPATVAANQISFSTSGLSDGKYTAVVTGAAAGKAAEPKRLTFWVEANTFEWRDALIYMAMIDRLADGNPANNVAPPGGVDARTVYKGGDLEGVTNVIKSGYLDQLGVRALWLSPFNTNPAGPFMADDGIHQATGYHGYWPVKAREVDPRIGGAAALSAMVKEAHAHGIRVLMDFVVNHVHKDHEYFKTHPEWFRTGCVCGTNNCDWTQKRLECLFSDYLPDVNWSVPEVSAQYASDAAYWIDTFDLDGLRIDAVKHVEDLAVFNLTAQIREDFEAAGNRVFLTGETAMGWNDTDLAGNAEQYDTISRYMGPFGLDGQFDFVLYHAVPYRSFAYQWKGMLHADYWAKASTTQYTAGSIMTPYIGSHDTSRFVTLSSYRDQDGAHASSIPGNKWDNIAGPPTADAPARHRLALAWLLGLPGAPLLYYGDEYGEWGGADPNNRVMFRGNGSLSSEEQQTLALTRALGKARQELLPLRRGSYRSVYATEEHLVYARQTPNGEAALVVLNRGDGPVTIQAELPATLTFPVSSLRDRLGGPNGTVSGGVLTLALPAHGMAVLAP